MTLTVTRTGGSSGAASVNYATANGTATAGSDYTTKSGTLNWADGDAAAKTFTVTILNDSTAEGAESFTVNLSGASGAALGSPTTATVTIPANDQVAGTLQFNPSTYTVDEAAGTVTLTVTRTGGSSGAASVNYATANGTATAGSDYTAKNGTLNWADGDSASKTFAVTILNDSSTEGSESFSASISGATGATLGSPTSATVTIPANDNSSPLNEALDASDLTWTTGGSANWFSQTSTTHDGVDAARSGTIGLSQESWMETSVTGPGFIRFWRKVSSENGYDYLRFYIDGTEQSGSISGEVDWQQASYSIPSGLHTLRWAYTEDYIISAGSDCGWVDQVVWWPTGPGYDPSQANDFDGDGVSDIGVFHPKLGNWHLAFGGGGGQLQQFGWSQILPVPADYDGDGATDFAVYHPATGNWYVRESSNGQTLQTQFGWSALVPLPGDYDGDGRADLAVYYPAEGRWYFLCTTAGRYTVQWGWSAAIPVPADYDGDGKTDIAVYHAASGNWYIFKSSDGQKLTQAHGFSTAIPVPADYDGDGRADIAVLHRGTGTWRIKYSGGGSLYQQFGWSATIPVEADYDGDGKADLAVYHPQSGNWYVLKSTTGETTVRNWGWSEAKPTLLYPMIHSWFGLP